jgi:hypothetical protein
LSERSSKVLFVLPALKLAGSVAAVNCSNWSPLSKTSVPSAVKTENDRPPKR